MLLQAILTYIYSYWVAGNCRWFPRRESDEGIHANDFSAATCGKHSGKNFTPLISQGKKGMTHNRANCKLGEPKGPASNEAENGGSDVGSTAGEGAG